MIFRVQPSDKFTREGDDILYNHNISFAQAALGDEVKIPTLKGHVMLTVPEGTQTGKQFRLKGKGIKMSTVMAMVIYLLTSVFKHQLALTSANVNC